MDLDSIQLTKKRRRLILGSLFLLALGYLLTHTFEYSCVFTENQNSPTQGCISGPELKNYSVLLWSFARARRQ